MVSFFERMLSSRDRGVMAGVPTASFLANIYLTDMDFYFYERSVSYFRYSDDIIVFARTKEERDLYKDEIFKIINNHNLKINMDKYREYNPGEEWSFLGICYRNGNIDLSDVTLNKIKGKIKRKAAALRRWAHKKNLDGEKAAKGFISAINHKFYEREGEDSFSWSKWYFPNITTDESLRLLDDYIVEYIRFCVTGRHYKGNFRISYETIKDWGYKSLVHEYYAYRKD